MQYGSDRLKPPNLIVLKIVPKAAINALADSNFMWREWRKIFNSVGRYISLPMFSKTPQTQMF